jgi:uncharacterized protein YegP (UPF0339 family)
MMAGKLEGMEAPVAYYVYPDDGGRWRWVLSDRAGRPLAVSPESYEREEECRRMIAAVMRSASAPVLRT